MYLYVLDPAGEVLLHQNIRCDPAVFLALRSKAFRLSAQRSPLGDCSAGLALAPYGPNMYKCAEVLLGVRVEEPDLIKQATTTLYPPCTSHHHGVNFPC